MRKSLFAAFLVLLLAGCATSDPGVRLSDAVTTQSRFGAPETSQFGTPVTGRNWTCRTCYN